MLQITNEEDLPPFGGKIECLPQDVSVGRNRLSSGCVERIYRLDLKSNLKMDPTVEFFAKLKKLAVTLESETDSLQKVFETRKSEDDTGE